MKRTSRHNLVWPVSLFIIVTLATPQALLAKSKCSADCEFGSGTIKCSRGPATCSCSSVGIFQGTCGLRLRGLRLEGDLAGTSRQAVAENSSQAEFSISEEQIRTIRAVSKMLRTQGDQHKQLATALDNLASAKTTKEIGAAGQLVEATLAQSTKETQALFASLITTLP